MTTNNGNSTLLHIEEMTKVYQMGDIKVHALRGVSLTVQPGEYVAIMGASGSGKSTLMNMIGLLDRPTGGSYKIRGTEASQMSKGRLADLRNQEIGFVFQQFNLLPRVSARRQVELPLFYGDSSGRKRREMALDALQRVGLGDRANHRPDELSGVEASDIGEGADRAVMYPPRKKRMATAKDDTKTANCRVTVVCS